MAVDICTCFGSLLTNLAHPSERGSAGAPPASLGGRKWLPGAGKSRLTGGRGTTVSLEVARCSGYSWKG